VKRNRSTLKEYFKKGCIPTESNFADLIDSMLNQEEDNIDKSLNGPLSVAPFGADEDLISFKPSGQNGKTGWQLKQKAGEKPGLSIGEGTDSRLFIESGTGNVGIGMATPGARLEVNGSLKVSGDVKASGTLYAGGNPVVFENFEIHLQGSAYESSEGNSNFLRIANIPVDMPNGRGLNTVILSPKGAFKNKTTHDVYENHTRWNDWATWVQNNASAGDIVAVASFDALQIAPKGGAAESLLRQVGALEAFSAVKGHQRSPYALLFVMGGRAAEVSIPHKGPNAKLRTTYYDLLTNRVRDDKYVRRSLLHHRMYPNDPLVYQDIFEARDAKVITKYGNPLYDDGTYSKPGSWNGRRIIRYGRDNENDGNGALVTIPAGYDTVWIRVLGERWTLVKAYFTDGQGEQLGLWAGGWRAANSYSPDGSLADSYQVAHQWLPIPAGRSGNLALIAKKIGDLGTNGEFWLSGVAFSRNPWSHAAQSGVAIHWASNGGNGTDWGENWHAWNNDVLSKIPQNTNHELMVPVLPSGRDKLLYLVEHNSNWNGAMHSGITVENQPIERLMATYDNPFARHWNGKFYERYIAAHIPAGLIPANKRWLSVRINMTKQDQGIHFREIGTHDFDVPLA
jgi:hypothetical protein